MRSAFVVVPLMGVGLALAACGASSKDCQYGQYWDAQTETCMQQTGQCPVGMMMGPQGCYPAQGGQCPQGQMWNGQMCVASGGVQCPQGQMWNGQTCVMQTGTPQCPQGQVWNGQTCVAGGGTTPQCPMGQQWNGQACVAVGVGFPTTGGGFPMGGGCTPPAALDPITQQAIGAAVTGYGQQQAAGGTPIGGMLSGNFQPGNCVEVQVTLNPGKCYTAVGLGNAGEEVDLLINPPFPSSVPLPAIAQDNSSGNTAILGQSPNCYRPLVPTPAKFVLKVSSGQGPAAAQLYER